MVKPFFVAIVVNFIFQVAPIVLMDIYLMMFIEWGYEIMEASIDNLILALVIFVLEIVEFAYYKRKAVEDKEVIPKDAEASLTNK